MQVAGLSTIAVVDENERLEDEGECKKERSSTHFLEFERLPPLPIHKLMNFWISEDSEAEDDIIKPTDNLLLLGHVADDSSTMEVWGKLKTAQTHHSRPINQILVQYSTRRKKVFILTTTSCCQASRSA